MKEITLKQHHQLVKEGKLKRDNQPTSNRQPRVYFRWKNDIITESKRCVCDKNMTVAEVADSNHIKIEAIPKKYRNLIITDGLIINLDDEFLQKRN
mgnify:FL=1